MLIALAEYLTANPDARAICMGHDQRFAHDHLEREFRELTHGKMPDLHRRVKFASLDNLHDHTLRGLRGTAIFVDHYAAFNAEPEDKEMLPVLGLVIET